MRLLKTVDELAKGRGLTMARAVVTHKDGSQSVYFSHPKLRWWDGIGWLWYLVHKRALKAEV